MHSFIFFGVASAHRVSATNACLPTGRHECWTRKRYARIVDHSRIRAFLHFTALRVCHHITRPYFFLSQTLSILFEAKKYQKALSDGCFLPHSTPSWKPNKRRNPPTGWLKCMHFCWFSNSGSDSRWRTLAHQTGPRSLTGRNNQCRTLNVQCSSAPLGHWLLDIGHWSRAPLPPDVILRERPEGVTEESSE